jgi:indolepyruvate ferredoxin oxidoreductase alpha subunit
MEKNNFKKEVLMGNEAIVQGALEAGVDFVTMYPGCPSAEIGDEFGKIAKDYGVYYEISTNEKVALESAIGASFSGLKSLVAMKNFGVNVCSEVLLPLCYTGTKAPMVIVVGDDPGCWSSAQTEENSRAFSLMAHIPTLEPSDAQECRDFVKLGFEISEKFNIPVMIRTTIRVAHQRAPVEFEEVIKNPSLDLSHANKAGKFEKNFHQYVTLPPRVLEMKKELLEKTEKIRTYFEKSKINFESKKSKNNKLGIIVSGVAYLHTMQVLQEMPASPAGGDLDLSVLKISSFYPLPKKKIADFVKRFKQVLVIEELEPYLERELKIIANDNKIKTKIIGKELLPEIGELNVEKIGLAIAKVLGLKIGKLKNSLKIENLKLEIPRRTAKLCDGCPYWYALPLIKKLAPENVVWGGDIGCNMMTGLAPHNMQDYLFCMGSSIGIGHGVSKATGRNNKAITIMGDGTFFHSGMAGLINAVYNKSNPLMIILDNRITAMTGHQQNPGMGQNGMWQSAPEMNIEEIVKAFGVKNVKTLDQGNPGELETVMREFLTKDDVSVIICKRICAILDRRQKREKN